MAAVSSACRKGYHCIPEGEQRRHLTVCWGTARDRVNGTDYYHACACPCHPAGGESGRP